MSSTPYNWIYSFLSNQLRASGALQVHHPAPHSTMPKRSRSASPLPSGDTASVDEDAPAVKSSTTDPAHNPKYFRSSTSPSPDPSSSAKPPVQQMQCGLPPHGVITLPSAAAFDEHYAKEHTNRCSACGANLPSAWFLELHLSERHDPLIATRREKEEKTVSFNINRPKPIVVYTYENS